jgi:hypothetical protein
MGLTAGFAAGSWIVRQAARPAPTPHRPRTDPVRWLHHSHIAGAVRVTQLGQIEHPVAM